MIRATTVKKNAKAKAVNAKNSNQGDGIVATIILPPGKEHVLEDIKRVMADSILIDRRPEPERPTKKEQKKGTLNLSFIANSIAEEFVDCVKECGLGYEQAIWYLELIRSMHEANENMAAFSILHSVLYYAGSPAASAMNDLFDQLNRMSLISCFFDSFLEHDEIDDYLMELTLIRAGMDDDPLLS